MKSAIVQHLQPEFAPVALVGSDRCPDDAVRYKSGRFGCVLDLFATASRQGRVAAASRESLACAGGRAALGLGVDFAESAQQLDRYAALFSKGLRSTRHPEAYRAHMDKVPAQWRALYEFGERRHCDAELAREWLLSGLPDCDLPHRYILFEPLDISDATDHLHAVIFPVTPLELAGLATLVGSVMRGTDPIRAPQGPDCVTLGAFAYAEAKSETPRAILGMLGVDGREIMRKRFRDDVLTLTLPGPLFRTVETEAGDCILQTPGWQALVKERPHTA